MSKKSINKVLTLIGLYEERDASKDRILIKIRCDMTLLFGSVQLLREGAPR